MIAPGERLQERRQRLVAGDERLFEFTLDTRPDRDKAEAFTRFRALVAALRARSSLSQLAFHRELLRFGPVPPSRLYEALGS